MPVIDFQHEESGEIISVLVPLTAPAVERQTQTVETEMDGQKVVKVYKRIWAAPQVAKDTKRKEGTKDDYRRVTGDKKLTVGEMWDVSREMSQERAERNGGRDPVQEQMYKDYEKKMGSKHMDVKKREAMEKAKAVFEANGIKVS